MRKEPPTTYLLLIGALLFLMSLPGASTERMRGGAVALFAPTFEQLSWIGTLFRKEGNVASKEELQRLQLENQLLYSEIERLQEIVQHELFLKEVDSVHTQEVQRYLALQMQSLPARVIFRSPNTWNSSIWINVGENDNKKLDQVVIQKNSPVMMGMSIVGVVDYVGKHQCRVRLITDSGLNPSVRVSREGEAVLLAKGELCGCSQPMWRAQGKVLKGTGFNYDFSDREGEARDLRTGLPKEEKSMPIPLISPGDLLVTTGMDGVFPKGMHVAKVSEVAPLKEGDYFYEIEAIPTAGDLNEIDMVMVLPPMGFNPLDKPPLSY